MNHPIKTAIPLFLEKYWDKNSPLLVGLSGGPDSLALLHLLLDFKNKYSLPFAIAHVDHGWRQESSEEANQLAELADKLKIPFHLKTLKPENIQGNLEAACRQERLLFFSKLCQDHGYQAVLLGHHAGDQVENVLKKIFEGKTLPYLTGMKEAAFIDNLAIWRPLLKIEKSEIIHWLQRRGIVPFIDPTNIDPKFLRARLRTDILPTLSEKFGKTCSGSLMRIGEESQELKKYLDAQVAQYLTRIIKTPMGIFLDLENSYPPSKVEMKHLVHRFCEKENFFLSYELIERASELLLENSAHRQLIMGSKKIHIDRRRLFLPNPFPSYLLKKRMVKLGSFSYGEWNISVSFTDLPSKISDWKEAWQGEAQVSLPVNDYLIGPPPINAPFQGTTSISKWWSNAKVPAFLRTRLPVIWLENAVFHEFLTGRTKTLMQKQDRYLQVILKLKEKSE
jgi:tRNA(Ile)-lysidine synthase